MVGLAILGVPLFVVPNAIAVALGFRGEDEFVFRLGGSVILGFAVGLFFAIREERPDLRVALTGVGTFGAASAVASVVGLTSGSPPVATLLILVLSVLILLGCYLAWGQSRDYVEPRTGRREIALHWVLLSFAGLPVLLFFAVGAFVLGGGFGHFLGEPGFDDLLYRLAGAGAFGYGTMIIVGIRLDAYRATRLETIMELSANVLAGIACLIEIARGGPLIAVVVLVLAIALASAAALYLVRRGR